MDIDNIVEAVEDAVDAVEEAVDEQMEKMFKSNGSLPPSPSPTIFSELSLFIQLAIPTILANLGMIASPMLCASFIGRNFEPIHLSGFALANLIGNLCTFSLLLGLFSASDTLGPQAFGNGDFREVGLIAIRGLVCASALVIPINLVLVNYLEDVLLFLGQDEEAVVLAVAWYNIYVLSFPFCIVYNVIWKFLSAQHIMNPMICVSLASFGIILPTCLHFMTMHFGFLGSAWAYFTFQAVQATSLLVYVCSAHPHTRGTWPGISSWRDAILAFDPMVEFVRLGLGGMVAQCEWVFWECAALVIGSIGALSLSVHTIPSEVMMILWLPPLSGGTALSIRMGINLTESIRTTKKLILSATFMVMSIYAVINTIVYLQSERIIMCFTNDAEVLAIAQHMWWKLCIFSQTCSLFGMLQGVATGLGMQWWLACINFVSLWVFVMPILYYSAVVLGGGLEAAWVCIIAGYTGMNISLLIAFARVSFKDYADEVEEKFIDANDNEETLLMQGIKIEYGSNQT
ncbi:unnamed protein product [Cylindrotheca closterium]|uniref:Protein DETOXIFICATION n=1 Tax=Cylindrotheca closterium TaxID=2856 RepID=A0AAD2JLN8_9STRA|nr:unnamed protein product [Cylindrotheca closterium]